MQIALGVRRTPQVSEGVRPAALQEHALGERRVGLDCSCLFLDRPDCSGEASTADGHLAEDRKGGAAGTLDTWSSYTEVSAQRHRPDVRIAESTDHRGGNDSDEQGRNRIEALARDALGLEPGQR